MNDDVFKPLVARARWRIGLHDDGGADLQPVELTAAPTRRALGFLIAASRRLLRACRFIHAGRLEWRTRRQALEPRELVLGRLMLDPKRRQLDAKLLVLRPQPRHFANKLANHADQIGMCQTVERIRRRHRHPQLESHF